MSLNFLGITWASPEKFIWLLLMPIVFGLLLLHFYKTSKIVEKLTFLKWREALLKHFSFARFSIKLILLFAGTFLLLLALLRPQWNEKERPIKQEGRDLFIAIDISLSMLCQDIKPNRLECAKLKIKKLINKLQAERVGLILFSGSAVIQCPMTSDFNTFMLFLDQIDTETISSGTTAIDSAIEKAIEAYERMSGKKNKLLLLITDGEDFSRNLRDLKKRASAQGMRIFTLGVGTSSGAPIPLINEKNDTVGYLKDERSKIVISRLNEGILSSLAHDVSGVYIKVTQDETDIQKIIDWILHFQKEQFEDTKISTYEEQYPYFVLISFLCFALEWIL